MIDVSTIISSLVAVVVALIKVSQYKEQRKNEMREKEAEKREELRNEGALLQMRMVDATLDLGLITAKTVLMKKTNGDVENALDKAMEIKEKVEDHLIRVSQAI